MYRMTTIILKLLILLAVMGYMAGAVDAAEAHYYAGCKKAACKKHVIKPHKPTLRARGACEAFGYQSRYTRNLRHGLRVVSSAGYRGRYQFDWGSWRGAGGKGDPVNAGWLEQAYRAVVWQVRHGGDAWPNCP